jgi:Zn-dependent protease
MIITNKLTIAIISIAVIMISVIIHEVMHGLVAKWLGDTTAEEEGRLTLNPIPHIDPITTLALPIILAVTGQPIFGAAKPVPVFKNRLKWEEFGMALVGVAGPLTNLLLAVVGGLIVRYINVDSSIWLTWWLYFVSINIGFFLFNMIPVPPLDGSRVLYAFAPEPMQRIMDSIEPFGIFIVFGLVIFGLPLIGPVINGLYQSLITVILGL